jgi:putative membrane protein
MTWWCSARGLPWTWNWQPYPGVWLLALGVAAAYWWAITRMLPVAGVVRAPAASRRERAFFAGSVIAIWVALDWPVGQLGAGYLLSVHQVQYVLLVMVAPPLMLLGTPVWLVTWLVDRRRVRSVVETITRPVAAILICNAVVVLTHLPAVVDGLMTSQLGSFALDMAWLFAGLTLWWPVIRPVPEMNGLSYPGRFGYLLVATLIPGVPALFYFFANYPLYALYELAPPVARLPAIDDQFVAGIVMKLGSLAVTVTALTIIFFRWHRSDTAPETRLVLPKAVTDL